MALFTGGFNFNFQDGVSGWSYVSAGKANGRWINEGNPAGAIQTDSLGRNNTEDTHWLWTGTWEDIGVPVGATVDLLSGTSTYDYSVTSGNVVVGWEFGPFSVYSGTAAEVFLGNLIPGVTGTATSVGWTTQAATTGLGITPLASSSDTPIQLRIDILINLGNDKAAAIALRKDNFNLKYIYDIAAVNTTGSGIQLGTADILKTVSGVQPGQADIFKTVSGVQPGLAAILQTYSGIQLGKADILNTYSGVLPGKGDILNTNSGIIVGGADILRSESGIQFGVTAIVQTYSGVQPGKADILNTYSGILPGKADILNTTSGIIFGRANINDAFTTTDRLQDGTAQIVHTNFLTNSLMAHWKMDESGGTRYDAHSTNHLTDINTVSSGSGKINYSAQFVSGNNEVLQANDNVELSLGPRTDFTIALWVKHDILRPVFDVNYVLKGNGGNQEAEYHFYHRGSGDDLTLRVGNGQTYGSCQILWAPNPDQWYLLMAGYKANEQKLFVTIDNTGYVTGVLPWTGGTQDTAGQLSIGAGGGGAGEPLYGNIDSVSIWKRSLTDYERGLLWNNGSGLDYDQWDILAGLKAHWKLDETTGTRRDAHRSLDLYASGVDYLSGKLNNAADFNGSNAFLYVPSSMGDSLAWDNDQPFTIAAWIKPETLGDGFDTLFSYSETNASNSSARLRILTNNKIGLTISPESGGGIFCESDTTISTTAWYFVCARHDTVNDLVRLRVNKTEAVSGYAGGTNSDGSVRTVHVGAFHLTQDTAQSYFDGLIDSVSVWNRSISDAEVEKIYNDGFGVDYSFNAAVKQTQLGRANISILSSQLQSGTANILWHESTTVRNTVSWAEFTYYSPSAEATNSGVQPGKADILNAYSGVQPGTADILQTYSGVQLGLAAIGQTFSGVQPGKADILNTYSGVQPGIANILNIYSGTIPGTTRIIKPLTVGLESHWKLNETTGTRYDSHGTNHLTDINTVGWTGGVINNAAHFVGGNGETLSKLDNSSLSVGNTSFTFACWFYFDALAGEDKSIISKFGGADAGEYYLYYRVSSTNLRWRISNGVTSDELIITTPMVTGQWYFGVFWLDITSGQSYARINNQATPDSRASNSSVDSVEDFWIGSRDNDRFHSGHIDSVSFWKRTLSSEEQSALYNNGLGFDYPFLPEQIQLGTASIQNTNSGIQPGKADILNTYSGIIFGGADILNTYSGVIFGRANINDAATTTDRLQDGTSQIVHTNFLTNSLMAHWKMDESGGVRYDAHGTNHLTDTNTVGTGTGVINLAANFVSGNNERFQRADNVDLSLGRNTSFTIAAWIMTYSQMPLYPNARYIMFKGAGGNQFVEYHLYHRGSDDTFMLRVGNGSIYASAVVPGNWQPTPNQWYFVTAGHDADKQKLFLTIDNTGYFTGSWSGGTQDSTAPVYIGGGNSDSYWDGKIDSMSFWKRALTDSERGRLYNNGVGLDYDQWDILAGLKAHWKLDETTGTRRDAHRSLNLYASGVGYASGKLNNAGDFDENNNNFLYNFDSSNPLGWNIDQSFTLCCWFKPETIGNNDTIFSYSSQDLSANALKIYFANTDSLRVQIESTGLTSYCDSPIALAADSWYFICARHDSQNDLFRLRVNTTESVSGYAGGTNVATGALTLIMGAAHNNGISPAQAFSNGLIDSLSVWNRSISDAEVEKIYNDGFGVDYSFNAAVKQIQLGKASIQNTNSGVQPGRADILNTYSGVQFGLANINVENIPGTIAGVRVNATSWQAEIDIYGLTSGGHYEMGFGPFWNPDYPNTPAIKFNVTSSGFDDYTNPITIGRTVWGMSGLRLPYPDDTLKDEKISNGILTTKIILSEYIYSGDIVTCDISGGFYTADGTGNSGVTNFSVLNSGEYDYPKVSAHWSWPPPYTRITGSGFSMSCVAFQKFAQSGRPVRVVKFIANDTGNNYISGLVGDMILDESLPDAVPVCEYKANFSTSGLVQGSVVTGNFVAYPWVGNINSVFDTRDSIYTQPTLMPAPTLFLNDKDNTYGITVAVVNSLTGNNGAGQAINYTGFDTGVPPPAYATIAAAASAIASYNNTNYGRNDVGGGIVYLQSGHHTFTSGNNTYGNTPNTYISITTFPGHNKTGTIINNRANQSNISNRIKFDNIAISGNPDALCSNVGAAWLNNCYLNVDGTRIIYLLTNWYVTHCVIDEFNQELKGYNQTTSYAPTLIRGNTLQNHEFNGSYEVYVNTVLGNVFNLTGMNFVSMADRQIWPTGYPIFAYNKTTYSRVNGDVLSYVSFYGTDVTGAVVVQNLFENIGEDGGVQNVIYGSVDASGHYRHVIIWNNSMPGAKNIVGYNDQADGIPRYRTDWSQKGNIVDVWAHKTDNNINPFIGTRTGNWSIVFGVGNEGNFLAHISGIAAGTAFDPQLKGLRSIDSGDSFIFDSGYIQYRLHRATTDLYFGSGSGDYRLKSTSPLLNLKSPWLLPYDLDGKLRSDNDPPGCYRYKNYPLNFIKPSEDVSTGTWGASPLYNKINETYANDADYITSSITPTNDEFEIKLSGINKPTTLTDHTIWFRYSKTDYNTDIINLTVSLLQGNNAITSGTFNNIPNAWIDGSIDLTTGEVAQITDYNDLRLRFTANNG